MWGVRQKVSLLLANGHPQAADYPLGMVRDEAEMINQRVGQHLAAEATVLQAAVGTTVMFSSKQSAKKAWDHFAKLVNRLMGE